MAQRSPTHPQAPVLFAANGEIASWAAQTPAGAPITKIVIGEPPSYGHPEGAIRLSRPFPKDFAKQFESLSHLYLWGINDLPAIPPLPESLRCLDVRACPSLESLPPLPLGLEALVVEGCPRLRLSAPAPGLGSLRDLSIRGCPGVSQEWLQQVLDHAADLVLLDASACPQITNLTDWPARLEVARLDDCPSLATLPEKWPATLRRIGLRNATALQSLPPMLAAMDYVDIAGTATLRKLDLGEATPFTLFIHGSDIRFPPKTEHGDGPDDNVAARVLRFFRDVRLTGRGRITRCKVLVLGNGGAGKTSLSLDLVGDDPLLADDIGSTHGVQFWDHRVELPGATGAGPVHVHVWDFGGQDIYHGTHRKFMGSGAVFVLVWKPEQDGTQPRPNAQGYTDEWRDPGYWLEFVRLASGGRSPCVAVVCSHRHARDQELVDRLASYCPPGITLDPKMPFFIASRERRGERTDLYRDWLPRAVRDEIEDQGTDVPIHWQFAQEMVEGWLGQMTLDPAFRVSHNQLKPERFRQELLAHIELVLANDGGNRFESLRRSIAGGEFTLDDERLADTLGFLSRSGWVYWTKDLFQGRVIVGQQWALDGVYAVLNRRDDSRIYRPLMQRQGRFTREWLGEHAWIGERSWNDLYDRDEQDLLLSFMADCGLCFALGSDRVGAASTTYVSIEHLPKPAEVAARPALEGSLLDSVAAEVPAREGLVRHQWFLLLQAVGREFGEEATYSSSVVQMPSAPGEIIRLTMREDRARLGGAFEVRVAGPDAAARLPETTDFVRRLIGAEGQQEEGASTGFRPSRDGQRHMPRRR